MAVGVAALSHSTEAIQGAFFRLAQAASPHLQAAEAGRIVAVSELTELHTNEVAEVRFLNAGEAMQRFGKAARSGPIILVTTKNK